MTLIWQHQNLQKYHTFYQRFCWQLSFGMQSMLIVFKNITTVNGVVFTVKIIFPTNFSVMTEILISAKTLTWTNAIQQKIRCKLKSKGKKFTREKNQTFWLHVSKKNRLIVNTKFVDTRRVVGLKSSSFN